MRVPKHIIERILKDNPDAEYVNINLDEIMKESYSDAMSRLACVYAICTSDMTDSEKVAEICEQTKSRR